MNKKYDNNNIIIASRVYFLQDDVAHIAITVLPLSSQEVQILWSQPLSSDNPAKFSALRFRRPDPLIQVLLSASVLGCRISPSPVRLLLLDLTPATTGTTTSYRVSVPLFVACALLSVRAS
jgi:hypothetical protein